VWGSLSGEQAVAMLATLAIVPATFPQLQQALQRLVEAAIERREPEDDAHGAAALAVHADDVEGGTNAVPQAIAITSLNILQSTCLGLHGDPPGTRCLQRRCTHICTHTNTNIDTHTHTNA
jgi:hypothetical protein